MMSLLSANGSVVTSALEPSVELLAATVGGLVRLQRAAPGQSWEVKERCLVGTHPSALVRAPSGRLLCGLHYSGGVMVSDDDGHTWAPSNAGLESGHVYSLALQPVDGRMVVYAGTEPPMLYRSEDLGGTWHKLDGIWNVPDTDQWRFPPPPHIAHVKNVAFHPSYPQTLYVCVEQGDLLKSQDGGTSWRSLTGYEKPGDQFRRDMHRVLIRPSDPQAVYLASGCGLYFSADGGESWEHLTPGNYTVGYPDCLFFDPLDERTLYMAGASRAPNPRWRELASAEPAVLRSRDGGCSWTRLVNGLPELIGGNIEAMAAHRSAEQLSLFAGTSIGEIWGSDDGGDNWSLLIKGIDPISKGAHYRHFVSAEQRARIEAELRGAAA
jgi:photosystem II stability/assembly factor-like uncharacterized protein